MKKILNLQFIIDNNQFNHNIFMKKIYLSILLAGATLFSFAQSKIDLNGQAMLHQYKLMEKLGSENPFKAEKEDLNTIKPFGDMPERVVVLIDLNKEANLAELEAEGAVIRSQIDNLALVEIDVDKVVAVSNLKSVKSLSMPKMAKPLMDQARTKTGVNTVHRPLGQLPQAYKGAGVVTGRVDAGVTANHPNFKNSDGTSRVKAAWTITGKDGIETAYDSEYKLGQFTTDLSTMSHGTHVAGIMAGSYKNLADTINYYGVASESDILMVGLGNDAYDNNILMGIENIIEYAEANNQPCVVNLSMGSGYGPHDGTELFSQYIDKLAERAVICVAAGNEADMGYAITKTMTASDKTINSFVMPTAYKNGQLGNIEIWSNTNQAFKVTPVLYDLTQKTIVYAMPAVTASTNGEFKFVSTKDYSSPGDISSAVFENAYTGYIGVGSKVDEYNNRYTAQISYYLVNSANNPTGNVAFGVMIEGNAGQRIDVYAPSGYSTLASNDISGWMNGGGDGSITDASCAKNVISVGAFTSRDKVPVRVKGYAYNFSSYVDLDDIAAFSSYGTLVDGRKLPHLTAPGAMIVSSMSPYYMTLALQQGVYDNEFMLVGKTTYNNSPYYYDYMMGTSMAAPFASGAVALMLQANPELTSEEVRSILINTATQDAFVENSSNPVQWGAGKINVLDAVKTAIQYNGVEDVKADATQNVFVSTVAQNQYEVTYLGANSVNATLYNVAGQAVVNASAQGENVVVDASNVASGVYVLAVEADGAKYTTKVVVK